MNTARNYDMKVNRKVYWTGIIIVWVLEVLLLVLGRDTTKDISAVRLIGLLGLLIVYLRLIMLRLRDAGKSGSLVFLCFIIPIFAIYAGTLPSVDES